MINMGLNEVLDLKECLEDIIEDMDPDHLSGMLSLCARLAKYNGSGRRAATPPHALWEG